MSKYYDASLVQIPSGYKAGTLYSVLPANGDGDFDFTRASIATRVNAEGLIETVASGVPRLDYPLLNGVVQSCPALLLEPARTNLLIYSEALSNWTDIQNATVTDNATISPDGSQNASRINETVDNAVHRIFLNPTIANAQHAFSVFMKAGTRDWCYLRLDSQSSDRAWFNIKDGLIGTVDSDLTASIEDYGNGWFRCTVVSKGVTFDTTPLGIIAITTGDNVQSYAGDVNEYIYAWGAQLEQGSYATSYIPTSGSAVARAAEVCNGAGTSAEFNDSEGVLFAEISALANDSSTRVITISDGTSNERVQLFYIGSNQIASNVTDGGVGQASMVSSVNILNNNKFAFKYKLNDLALWSNGFEVSVDTVATMPTGLNTLSFDNGIGASVFYGKAKQLIAFDAALTDDQLEDLTSWDSFEEMAASQLYTIY